MARPDQGDWTSVYGRTRVNRGDESTPIERLGASQDVTVSDLNVSVIQETRWLVSYNENDNIPISQRTEPISSYDSARGIMIGDM
jgi:hypothetical protein